MILFLLTLPLCLRALLLTAGISCTWRLISIFLIIIGVIGHKLAYVK